MIFSTISNRDKVFGLFYSLAPILKKGDIVYFLDNRDPYYNNYNIKVWQNWFELNEISFIRQISLPPSNIGELRTILTKRMLEDNCEEFIMIDDDSMLPTNFRELNFSNAPKDAVAIVPSITDVIPCEAYYDYRVEKNTNFSDLKEMDWGSRMYTYWDFGTNNINHFSEEDQKYFRIADFHTGVIRMKLKVFKELGPVWPYNIEHMCEDIFMSNKIRKETDYEFYVIPGIRVWHLSTSELENRGVNKGRMEIVKKIRLVEKEVKE